jgi:CMP-N,N'-diacetyllegionaminic acid synthase
MKKLCVISARGGSSGVPGKNIRMLFGKPLIAWSIEQALGVREIDRLVVSTDSVEIASIARQYGAETPFMRPLKLSTSESGKFDVFKHALRACKEHYQEDYEFYLDLDCTNPLRDISDIEDCIARYRERREFGVDGIFTICNSRKNPYFNMLEINEHGALKMCKSLKNTVVRRQDAPNVFDHVASIYVLNPMYIENASHLLDGHTEGFNIGENKSLDIDSEFDFQIIDFLMRKKYSKNA